MNEKQVIVAALRRMVGRCEYLDESNAVRILADRIEADQEYGELAEQLQAVIAERDHARKERDAAHLQADTAEIRRQEAQTIAEGAWAERERIQQELDACKREIRSMRARAQMAAQAEPPADPPAAEPNPS